MSLRCNLIRFSPPSSELESPDSGESGLLCLCSNARIQVLSMPPGVSRITFGSVAGCEVERGSANRFVGS